MSYSLKLPSSTRSLILSLAVNRPCLVIKIKSYTFLHTFPCWASILSLPPPTNARSIRDSNSFEVLEEYLTWRMARLIPHREENNRCIPLNKTMVCSF